MTKGERTRQILIETVIKLFEKEGVHRVPLQSIAQEAGVSQATTYKYFEERQDLLIQACLMAAERGRAFIDARVPSAESKRGMAKDRLKAYIEGNLAWVRSDRAGAITLLSMYAFGSTDVRIKQTHLTINQAGEDRIEGFLLQGEREKLWTLKNRSQIAKMIHSLLSGEMIKGLHWPKDPALTPQSRQVWQWVSRQLGL